MILVTLQGRIQGGGGGTLGARRTPASVWSGGRTLGPLRCAQLIYEYGYRWFEVQKCSEEHSRRSENLRCAEVVEGACERRAGSDKGF